MNIVDSLIMSALWLTADKEMGGASVLQLGRKQILPTSELDRAPGKNCGPSKHSDFNPIGF